MDNAFFSFVENTPTSFHAAKSISKLLEEKGFSRFHPKTSSEKLPEKLYFQKDTLIIAAILPKKTLQRTVLTASHTDSPALRLKTTGVHEQDLFFLSTEKYGGPIYASWMGIPLALAGIVYGKKNGELSSKNIHLKELPMCIPHAAIHLNREVNEKGLVIDPQKHLQLLFGYTTDKKFSLTHFLKAQTSFDEILYHEIFAIPLHPLVEGGINRELIMGYRLDNLTSAYSCLEAIRAAKPREHTLQTAIFFDHEELGSSTSQGALSGSVTDFFAFLCKQYSCDPLTLFYDSIALSVDVSHGYHKNYQEFYDKENTSHLGKGTTIKLHGNRSYATTPRSHAALLDLAKMKNLSMQESWGSSKLRTGSTVGPLLCQKLGIDTLDIGISTLAMHSCCEVVHKKDLEEQTTLLKYAMENL